MSADMKAAILEQPSKIVVKDIPVPQLSTGEVLVKVELAGICGSDVHIYRGDNLAAKMPVVQGHEFTGTVTQLSDDNQAQWLEKRVAVQPLITCGDCRACREGFEHVCDKLQILGVNRNGGFAQYVATETATLTALDDEMPDEVAVLAEPFSIGVHSNERGQLKPGQRVLVTGAGPIGLCCAIVAKQLGAAQVILTEPLAARRALASELGLNAVDTANDSLAKDLISQTGNEGFHLCIETSGTDAGMALATDTAMTRANIVTLGFPHGHMASCNISLAISKELSFVGSRVCSRAGFRKALEILATLHGQSEQVLAKLVSEPQGLERLVSSIEDVEAMRCNNKALIQPN